MKKCNHEDVFSTVLGFTCLDCGLIIRAHPGKEEAVGFANALIIAANGEDYQLQVSWWAL